MDGDQEIPKTLGENEVGGWRLDAGDWKSGVYSEIENRNGEDL